MNCNQDYQSFVSFPGDPVTDQEYADFIAQTDLKPASTDVNFCFFYWCMKARHVLYWLSTPPSYASGQLVRDTDCKKTGYVLPLGELNAVRTLGSVAGTVGAAASAAGALATAGSLVGAVAGAALTAVSIIALPLAIFGFLAAQHAKAVAHEQATLCDVIPSANLALDTIDYAFATGQISLDQAIEDLDSLARTVSSELQSITKACNAACVMDSAVQSLVALRKTLYATPPAGISGGASQAAIFAVGGLALYAILSS